MTLFKRIASASMAAALCCTMTVSFGGQSYSASSADVLPVFYDAAELTDTDIRIIEIMTEQIENFRTEPIDLSSYKLSYEHFEELYGLLVWSHPEFFYVSATSAMMSYDSKGRVSSFVPVFSCTQSKAKLMQKEIDAYTDDLLSAIGDDWKTEEKILYVHEYIVSRVKYYSGASVSKGRTIYDAFIKGEAVCVGYTAGFKYIMDKLNIPCISITTADHIWNMVKVDSKWYHIDLTWNDSLFDGTLSTAHLNMLMSEEKAGRTMPVHKDWDYSVPANSTIYDDYFWNDVFSVMTYHNGKWYYTDSDGLCAYSFSKGKKYRISSVKSVWAADNGKEWIISFGKTFYYNNGIYFNTASEVYRYDLSSKKTSTVCTPKLKNGCQIMDMSFKDGVLTVYSTDDVNNLDKYSSTYILDKEAASEGSASGAGSSRIAAPKVSINKSGNISIKWDDIDAEQYIIYRYDKNTGKTYKVTTTVKTRLTLKYSEKYANSLFAVQPRMSTGKGKRSEWAGLPD